ncbi:MAG: hypothetical protein WCA84_15360 [Ignavibacteriaceae bacterium]
MGDTIFISNQTTSSAFFGVNPFIREIKDLYLPVSAYYLEYNPGLDSMRPISEEDLSESFLTMLASEDVLKKEWDNPIEDEAWADL